MALDDDPWIATNSIIDPERLHALGMITLWWNHCERNLLFIFGEVFDLTPRARWIIANDIGDIALSAKITERLKTAALEADICELLLRYLDVYDKCRINRNALTHFTASIPDEDPAKLRDATFVRMKGHDPKIDPLPSSLEDIRRVAFETLHFAIYSWNVYKALRARKAGKPATLPPLLASPDLLWKPLPPTAPKPKRPPRPSAASRRKAAMARKKD